MEEERERNISVWLPLMLFLLGTWPTTQACALTGNRTGDLLVHRPVLNPLSHTSHGIKKRFYKMKIWQREMENGKEWIKVMGGIGEDPWSLRKGEEREKLSAGY